MNYYIQGNKEKADKIKAAFEKLGIDVLDFGFADKTLVYCSIGGCVQCLPYSINLMHILYSHPDYQELELPIEPKFKVGDWITCVDDDGDTSTEMIEDFWGDKVRLIDCDGVFTLYPKSELKQYHLWSIADAKDGDVLSSIRGCPFIYDKYRNQRNNLLYYYAGINGDGDFVMKCPERMVFHFGPTSNASPATKEERDLLFRKMREAGYQWNADKKELRKIQPHYDISNFYAGMPVLVRDNDKEWRYVPFSHITNSSWKFNAVGTIWEQCIPFNDDTKHLVGTTNPCDEQYINW